MVIDPKGLILCSNLQLTGMAGAFMGMGMGRGGAVPTNIRVLIGDDTQGLKAKLLARDSELDLAWIELTEPAPKPLAAVDLTKATKPRHRSGPGLPAPHGQILRSRAGHPRSSGQCPYP